jgi:serine protease DegS
MSNALKFITWPAIAGVLAALLILDRWVLPTAPDGRKGEQEPVSYAHAVNKASPSVVNIYTAKLVTSRRSPLLDDRFFRRYSQAPSQRQRVERSLGSGVIMSAEGHILTNAHVIAGADAIQVLLHDGRTAQAMVIASDQSTDLAVLKVDLPDLQAVELADSDAARVGDVVLAIGNPLGFGHSVTQGIVSALGRYGLQLSAYEDYIQTDAIIHLGNSGGALIDARGRLLGINTLIYTGNGQARNAPTGIGISLAIPANLAVFVMSDLINYGEVIRGWLGVSVEPRLLNLENRDSREALLVVDVIENSPAARAGLRQGDLITHIDGEPVDNGRQPMHQIAMLRPGDTVGVSVLRDRQSLELRGIVGVRSQSGNAAP